MAKRKVTITLSEETLDWIDKEVKSRRFADRSHAVEYCLDFVRKGGEEASKKLKEQNELISLLARLTKMKRQLETEKNPKKIAEMEKEEERLITEVNKLAG